MVMEFALPLKNIQFFCLKVQVCLEAMGKRKVLILPTFQVLIRQKPVETGR